MKNAITGDRTKEPPPWLEQFPLIARLHISNSCHQDHTQVRAVHSHPVDLESDPFAGYTFCWNPDSDWDMNAPDLQLLREYSHLATRPQVPGRLHDQDQAWANNFAALLDRWGYRISITATQALDLGARPKFLQLMTSRELQRELRRDPK